MKNLLLFCFIVCATPFLASAQLSKITATKESRLQSEKNIRTLHDGTLLVRLESGRNWRRELLKLTPSEKKLRTYIEKKLKQLDAENRKIASAVQKHYHFSKYLIMYDSSVADLKASRTANIFMDSTLRPNESLRLAPNSTYFFLYKGNTATESSSGIDAYIFADENYKELFYPFPYYTTYQISSIITFLPAFFGIETNTVKNPEITFRKINKRLEKYYSDVVTATK